MNAVQLHDPVCYRDDAKQLCVGETTAYIYEQAAVIQYCTYTELVARAYL